MTWQALVAGFMVEETPVLFFSIIRGGPGTRPPSIAIKHWVVAGFNGILGVQLARNLS